MKKYMFHIIAVCLVFSFNLSSAQSWHTNFGDTLHNQSDCPNNCPNIKHIYINDSSVFFAGGFWGAGELPLRSIAKWKNYQWYNLGITYTNDDMYCIVKYENKLFVGGHSGWYPNDNYDLKFLSYWDGKSWNLPGTEGPNGSVRNFKIHNDTLFVCGGFTTIDGVSGKKIMAYYDDEWIHVGDVNANTGMVFEIFNEQFLIGNRYHGIRKRTGPTTWENFAGMSSGSVNDMVVDTMNNFLYIGGAFSYVGDSMFSSCVAMYDGFQWHSLDSGVNADVYSAEMYHGDLYVGGALSETTNGLELNYIGRWDGTEWHDLQGGCAGAVMALQVFQDTLIAGGAFYQVGLGEEPQRTLALAKWHMPESGCNYLQPVLHAYEEYGIPKDTFYLDSEAEVHFYNNNAYADSWQWDFGDGSTADVQEPVHTYTDTGEYEVSVTVSHEGCVKSSIRDVYVQSSLGKKEQEKPVMALYPNPSRDDFILQLESEFILSKPEYLFVKVINMKGQLVYSCKIEDKKTSIPSTGWPRGTYVCKLYQSESLISTNKIVLE